MKLDTFIVREAKEARANLAATGEPGCTPERLAWLERELAKHHHGPITTKTTKKEKAMPTMSKKAPTKKKAAAPTADAALAARYDKMPEETAAQRKAKAKILLDLYAKHGRYSVVRKIMGQGPNWTERQLDRLTGSHPTSTIGRARNGAVRTEPKPVKAASKKATAKAPAAKRVRKSPAKKAPAA